MVVAISVLDVLFMQIKDRPKSGVHTVYCHTTALKCLLFLGEKRVIATPMRRLADI
jgi:hypothetical protein